MALQDTTSRPFAGVLIRSAKSGIKDIVLEGANPRMHSAMLQIAGNPSHVKKLNVDSVVEIVGLLEDVELLERIQQVDKRVWVRDTISRRLHTLRNPQASHGRPRYTPAIPTMVSSQTATALRMSPVRAAGALAHMRAFDEALVSAWAATLSEEHVGYALGLADKTSYYSGGELRKTLAKRLAGMSAQALRNALGSSRMPGSLLRSYMEARGPIIDEATAVALANSAILDVDGVLLNLEHVRRFTVTPEAVAVWRTMHNPWHLLLFAGDLSGEELVAMMGALELADNNHRKKVLRFARNAEHVDFIVTESAERGWWTKTALVRSLPYYGSEADEFAPFLTVKGVNEDVVLAVLPHVVASVALRYALGEWDPPHQAAYEKAAETVKLAQLSWVGETEPAMKLAATHPGAKDFLRMVMNNPGTGVKDAASLAYGNRQNAVTAVVADVLNDTLGGNPVAWSMFMSFCEDSSEAGIMDLANAAASLT